MLLQALHEFYERATKGAAPLIDDPAFNPKRIRWIIPLDANGDLAGDGLIETTEEGNRAKEYRRAPRSTRPKNSGVVAEFLADELDALFGIESDPNAVNVDSKAWTRVATNLSTKRTDFWKQIKQAHDATNYPAFAAMSNFAARYALCDVSSGVACVPSFLRWGIAADPKEKDLPCWWVKTATGDEARLGADRFTFSVEGELLIEEDVVQDYWRRTYIAEVDASDSASKVGLCLVTGKSDVPIMMTHRPQISGVPGASPTGALLVSFEEKSFRSYGYEKSFNAPVSSAAVSAYANALNWMLRQEDYTLRIGNTVLCFWSRQSDSETQRMSSLLNRPNPNLVREFLRAPYTGDDERAPLEHDSFYSVMLSGSKSRITVRHWMQTTLKAATQNCQRWFKDLDIVTYGDFDNPSQPPPLAVKQLALTTVRRRKAKKKGYEPTGSEDDLVPEVIAQLYRAALEGSAPSLMLAKRIVDRFAAEIARDGDSALRNLSRFALLRLVVNRNRKEGDPLIEPELADTTDAAYNCGRLLAVFEDLQRSAHGKDFEGAGVVERYYGSASSAPNSAFGILWRLHQHHLKKLSRSGDQGRAKSEAIKRTISDIACLFRQTDSRFPPAFPRSFDMQAQGRFALGFYQQKAADRHARQSYIDAKKASAARSPATNNFVSSPDSQGGTPDDRRAD